MRTRDAHTFDSKAYETTVRRMRTRGEGVHDVGREHKQKTGSIHPYVDVRQNRGSHNAMILNDKGQPALVNGVALPICSMFDGTGSTSHWLTDFFHAAERQYMLMDGTRTRYNTQFASGVVQDICDIGHSPVVQLTQFESDERSAEQVRLLLPAGDGGDTTEDYDLGLVAGLLIDADIWKFYGLKGYFTLVADDIGRGFVTSKGVHEYLGQSLGQLGLFQNADRVTTPEICRQLFKHWHLFLLQVPARGMLSYSTSWWSDVLGRSRVVQVPDPSLLAEVRAGLVYVTEATTPTMQGMIEFMQRDANQGPTVRPEVVENIWRIVHQAEEHFSAQTKLPGYHEIPLPGDVFAHYRHAWPIGHSRESENVTPVETTIPS